MPRRRQNSESTNPVEERTPQVQSDTTPEENTVESGGSEERVQEEAADGVGTEEPAAAEQTVEEEAPAQTAGEETSAQVSEEEPSGAVQEEEVMNTEELLQRPLPVLEVRIHEQYFQDDILATADVRIGDICTIRNVKVREGDYGPEVVMPRTKLPETGRFKDACYFDSLEAKTQFDAAVMKAYQQVMEPITNAPDHESRYEDMDEEDMDYDEMGEIHGGMGGMNF